MRRYIETPFSLLNLIFDAGQTLLGLRFMLKLFGVGAGNMIVAFIYRVTEPLVLPFAGIFRNVSSNGLLFEWTTIVAMIGYSILAVAIIGFFRWLVSAEMETEAEEDDEYYRATHGRHWHA